MLKWHHVKNFRISTRGNKDTIKYLKSLYQVAQRYALNQPFDPIPFNKCDKEGFPSVLADFKKLLRGTVNEKRAALTVLYQYRLLYTEADKDTTSITADSN